MVFVAELARLAGRLDDRRVDRHREVLRLARPADVVPRRRSWADAAATRCRSTRSPAATGCASSSSTALAPSRRSSEAPDPALLDGRVRGDLADRPAGRRDRLRQAVSTRRPGPQRAEPRPARHPGARGLRLDDVRRPGGGVRPTGAASSGSTSRCARPTTRPSWSAGCTRPSTTGSTVVLNPAAFTHYSLRAARRLRPCSTAPLVEVHLSNPAAREEFRHTSVIAAVATGTIAGFGVDSYRLALQAVAELLPGRCRRQASGASGRSSSRRAGRQFVSSQMSLTAATS